MSLMQAMLPNTLKMAATGPLLKKLSLDPIMMENFHPVSNLPFLGKVVQAGSRTSWWWYLSSRELRMKQIIWFPFRLTLGNGTEVALDVLVDDLHQGLDRENASLLDLSAAFDSIDLWCPSGLVS